MQVRTNEIFGFLGHNGAGKTTTIKILVRICRQTEGQASILGIAVEKIEARTHIGYLPENPYFYEYLTGMESLEFYGRLSGLSRSECRQRGETILAEMGLLHAANRAVREYSKGMKQRLGLAQAMMHDPQVLILDEPLGGLDPRGRKELRDKICMLKAKGKTVFFSSHVLSDVEMLCDRVALLSEGKLISVGEIASLLDTRILSLQLILSDVSSQCLEQIKPQCLHITGDPTRTSLLVPDEDTARQVRQICEREGAKLQALIPHRESLEEYYFRQTKGEQQ